MKVSQFGRCQLLNIAKLLSFTGAEKGDRMGEERKGFEPGGSMLHTCPGEEGPLHETELTQPKLSSVQSTK
jgi:hypothetical protein